MPAKVGGKQGRWGMKKDSANRIGAKNWTLIWVLGMAGQICWNVENSWFNTFVYQKIAKDPSIVAWMVGVSAAVSTFCTFLIGTWSDRAGKRKPFICIGYILWGVFTVGFGLTEYLPKSPAFLAVTVVVAADAIMSFFGSVGYDGAFNPWTTDISNERNRGQIGGALAVMPVFATIFGSVVSGVIIDAVDFFAFFVIMGGLVTLMGGVALLCLKDSPTLQPRKRGSFWRQFAEVFRLSTIRGNYELFWVFAVMAVYFIGFNVYFPYITIFFTDYLGMSFTLTGIIVGVGLLAAAVLTIPVARFINRGKIPQVIAVALVCNTVGLLLVSFVGTTVPALLVGVFGAGVGYVLILQTLTAWVKNLYPADKRGQFEGIKQIFFVCIPMIVGPAIATPIINRFGKLVVTDGAAGMVPNELLFVISAVLALITFVPLYFAAKRFFTRQKEQSKKAG